MKKILTNPYVQAIGTVVGVLILLSFARPYLAKVPMLNRI